VSAIGSVPAGQAADAHKQLRQASRALEAVFLTQLLQAMRESIPEGGVTERGSSSGGATQRPGSGSSHETSPGAT